MWECDFLLWWKRDTTGTDVLDARSMDILMVTAELAPFCSGGEVGEAVSSLSRALVQQGHQVTVVMPKPADLEQAGIMVARRLTPLELSNGTQATVFDGQLSGGVSVILLESEVLQPRTEPYGEGGKDYPDNAQRFAELARSAEAMLGARTSAGNPFDAVMGHDVSGAFIPFAGLSVPTVLLIHDPTRLGTCTLKEIDATGMVTSESRELFKLGSRASLLKGGALAADVLACVSPRLAEHLKEPASGPLAAALVAADKDVFGVLGGIDYAVYNPTTDSALHTRFDGESSELKGVCKTALCRELEFELDPELPLVCWAAPLTKEAGVDLLVAALPKLLEQPLRLIVIGDPEPAKGAKALQRVLAASKYAKLSNYRYITQSEPSARRRTLAASDIAICVERNRVSGHGARVAQRYGAVPVVLDAPGGADAVVDCDASLSTGTGFLFSTDDTNGLLAAVERAVAATSRPSWGKLRRRVMKQDLSWERPARRYAQLFKLAARKL